MCVEPEQPYAFASLSVVAGRSSESAHGDGVISTQDQWKITFFQYRDDPLGQSATDFQYLWLEPGFKVFGCSGFHCRGRDVLFARDCITHAPQGIAQAGDSQR
jgi:hypothetical protein